MRHALLFALLVPLAGFVQSARAVTPHPARFTVIERVRLGGSGGWDYLHFAARHHRPFCNRGVRVLVFDMDHHNKVMGALTVTEGVRGVALAQDLDRGFTHNGRGELHPARGGCILERARFGPPQHAGGCASVLKQVHHPSMVPDVFMNTWV